MCYENILAKGRALELNMGYQLMVPTIAQIVNTSKMKRSLALQGKIMCMKYVSIGGRLKKTLSISNLFSHFSTYYSQGNILMIDFELLQSSLNFLKLPNNP
jgi:hypothetical protein